MRAGVLAVAALTILAVTTAAQTAAERAVVAAYRTAVATAERSGNRGGVEAAFASVSILRETLMRVDASGLTVLEALNEAEYAEIARLPGAIVNREEVVFVNADPDYFLKLAVAHGDAADRAFFGTLKATYPDSVWPIYVEQQTDYSGCTQFGSGAVVNAYRSWTTFQRRFPARYPTEARDEVNRAAHELTDSTCACGGPAAIDKELQDFLIAFPSSPPAPSVRARLQALRTGRSDIRASCISG